MFGRISFALDEKGKPVESSFVKRPTVLFSKNTATAANRVNKHSGGPDRNNHVLMEFHLNKVRSVQFPASLLMFVTHPSSLATVMCRELLRDIPKNGRWEACPKLGPKGKIELCKKSVFHCIHFNSYFTLNCDTFLRENYQKHSLKGRSSKSLLLD